MECDHVVPIAEGGRNDIANGRAICFGCHDEKSRAESERGYARRLKKLRLPPDPHPFYHRSPHGGEQGTRSET